MAKIVLVHPPIIMGVKRRFGFPPLGILYIATVLQKKGIDVKVIDSLMDGQTLGELTEEILKEKPDIVGFGIVTCQVNSTLDVAKELKKRNPSLKIVIGGPHISATKEELFKFTNDIDFLVYGEGEEAFYKFINATERNLPLENIDGLIYKKEGRVIVNKPHQLIQNLDDLPFPDLSLVDIKKYDSYYAKSYPLTSMIASRGCPFRCTFCVAYKTHGKALRLRSPKNIVDEMEHNLKTHKINQFMIKDSTFTVNKKWVYDICSEIKNRGLKINWTCNTRVDMVDEDILRAMKENGCHMIQLGIESGSQKVLDLLHKGITIEQVRNCVALCKKMGLEMTGYLMIGNPGETKEDARRTIEFAKELDLDYTTFGVTIAYPCSEIYHWALENNALQDRHWYMRKDMKVSNIMRDMDGNLNLKGFSPEEQAKIVKKANKEFYFRPSFIFRQLTKIKGIYDIKKAFKAVKEIM